MDKVQLRGLDYGTFLDALITTTPNNLMLHAELVLLSRMGSDDESKRVGLGLLSDLVVQHLSDSSINATSPWAIVFMSIINGENYAITLERQIRKGNEQFLADQKRPKFIRFWSFDKDKIDIKGMQPPFGTPIEFRTRYCDMRRGTVQLIEQSIEGSKGETLTVLVTNDEYMPRIYLLNEMMCWRYLDDYHTNDTAARFPETLL